MYVYSVTEFAFGARSEDHNIPKPQIYDDIYFDSDSEEEDTPSKNELMVFPLSTN